MMNQYQAVTSFIDELSRTPYSNIGLIDTFRKRLREQHILTRDEGVTSHFCTFFTPVVKSTGRIYIGHHIKSDSWLSPGGHIDANETPLDTVRREFREELQYEITHEKVVPFGLARFIISGRPQCTEHFDLWYLVYLDKEYDFHFERKEFYDAGWYTTEQAKSKKSLPGFRNEMERLSSIISV